MEKIAIRENEWHTEEHIVGADDCPVCVQDYPKICEICGGYIHGELSWEDDGGGSEYEALLTRCDKCKTEDVGN